MFQITWALAIYTMSTYGGSRIYVRNQKQQVYAVDVGPQWTVGDLLDAVEAAGAGSGPLVREGPDGGMLQDDDLLSNLGIGAEITLGLQGIEKPVRIPVLVQASGYQGNQLFQNYSQSTSISVN